jgi:hypothetical protein
MRIRTEVAAAATTLAPLIFLVLVAAVWIRPGSSLLHSQARIIKIFERNKTTADTDLVYLGYRPFSAQFYSAEPVKLARDVDGVTSLLRDKGDHQFAILTSHYTLPADLQKQLTVIAKQNETLLLVPSDKFKSKSPTVQREMQ